MPMYPFVAWSCTLYLTNALINSWSDERGTIWAFATLLATLQADLSVQDGLPATLQAEFSIQDDLPATFQADLSVQDDLLAILQSKLCSKFLT